ncbi:hypothetical protein [Halorubrum ezzemoulense]|uniref:hypothetical protein n=1 Tax=Halorubrum ezzemoulense TaxID=337243 RepID=UPI0011400A16|nr:hypothetical protein [Halorubrum ezzemoulense]
MKPAEIYIRELELSHEPNLAAVEQGGIELEFEVIGNPEYNEEIERLCGDFRLSLLLVDSPVSEDSAKSEQGSVDIEVTATVPGEREVLEDYINTWREKGYHRLPQDFRYRIESSFTTRLFAPVSGLIDNSFSGILPGMLITQSAEIDEETKAHVESVIEDRVQELVITKYDSEVDLSIDLGEFWEDDIVVESESLDELVEENEELQERINDIVVDLLSEHSPDHISSLSAEVKSNKPGEAS